MNIIVTGANGFIGKHVCRYLKEHGCYVVGLDLNDEQKGEFDEYVSCDLSTQSTGKIFERLKVYNVDAVVHLASDMRHEPYTVEVVEHNCVGMQRLLELCEKKSINTLVELSSLPVIGVPVQHPITEQHSLKPPTVYHVTKIAQEMLAEYSHYTFGLRTVSLRICAPVGIGMNPKTIFPTFIDRAVKNEVLTLIGKGTRKQTYIHVKDIAQAIYKSIISNAQGIYNLASYNIISNLELAKKCIELTNSSSEIVFLDQKDKFDDIVWDINIDKIKKDTGYEPLIDIDNAIIEYANEIRKEL